MQPKKRKDRMKKYQLTAVLMMAACTAAAHNGDTNGGLPNDTTKMIDIEEVIVIARPKRTAASDNSRHRRPLSRKKTCETIP